MERTNAMPVQLTPDQEHRIQAMVTAGAYASVEEALSAAVAAVETAAAVPFEGSPEELQALLQEGLDSGDPIDMGDAYLDRLRAQTNEMGRAHGAPQSRLRRLTAIHPPMLRSY